MSFFKKLFGIKETAPSSNLPIQDSTKAADATDTMPKFWKWFETNSEDLYQTLKHQTAPQFAFVNRLSPKIAELQLGIMFLAGMEADGTAELVFTADGNPAIFPFVEALQEAAPNLPKWKFTCFKQSMGTAPSLSMGGKTFSAQNISFLPVDDPEFPDHIHINFIYHEFDPNAIDQIAQGVLLYVEIMLGELDYATKIDGIGLIPPDEVTGEIVPIEKLKSYLDWRETEFVEKYEHVNYDAGKDEYAVMEGQDEHGMPAIGIANVTALKYEHRSAFPWILEVHTDFSKNAQNGFPSPKAGQEIDEFEALITDRLVAQSGNIEIGRSTSSGTRTLYLACRDFRASSKLVRETIENHKGILALSYSISKDKYWRQTKFLEAGLGHCR